MQINLHFIKNVVHNTTAGFKQFGLYYLLYLCIFSALNSGLLYVIDRTEITVHFSRFMGYVLLLLLFNSKLMVMMHQTELMMQKPRLSSWLKWTRHETTFLLWLISFAVLCFLLTYMTSFLAYPVMAFLYYNTPTLVENIFAVVLMALMAYVPIRCILTLPAAATGHRYAFSHSWQDTQYLGIELIILLLCLPLLGFMLLSFLPLTQWHTYLIAGSTLSLLLIIEAALLSQTFQALRPRQD